MTPRFLRMALSGACVAIALAAGRAQAVELYQWLDADGVVSIGPNPPPGVSAVPYAPGVTKAPAAVPTPVPIPEPTQVMPPLTSPAARPAVNSDVPCAIYTNAARQAASQVEDAEREIARLEARLEELDASDLAYARTECVSRNDEGPDPNCRATTFDRDKEITRSEKALSAAHDKLADVEADAREVVIPPRCSPASAD